MGRLTRIALTAMLVGLASLVASSARISVKAQAPNGYAARIVAGSCAEPGEEVFSLTESEAARAADGTPVPDAEYLGEEEAVPLTANAMVLDDASITSLTDEPHAIVLYSGDESQDQMIACGAIGGILTRQMAGMIMPGDVLQVGLGSVNGSGFSGIASLQSVEGGNLQVTILLIDASGYESGAANLPPGTPTP